MSFVRGGRMPAALGLAAALLLGSACDDRHAPAAPVEQPPQNATAPPAAAKMLSGAQAFAACQACHSLAKGAAHKLGPNLYGIAGAPAASQPGFHYSPALTTSGILWDKPHLIAWILDPEALAPASWMVYHNHLSPTEANRLADHILSAPQRNP